MSIALTERGKSLQHTVSIQKTIQIKDLLKRAAFPSGSSAAIIYFEVTSMVDSDYDGQKVSHVCKYCEEDLMCE